MILLSEKHKKTFVRFSDSILVLIFILFVTGFFLNRSGLERELSLQIIYAAVILALIATPIRLFILSLLFKKENQTRIARMALLLILLLTLGALLKWFFL